MSNKIVKIDDIYIEEEYFKYLKPVSKDDGLKSCPTTEDIKENKIKFEKFFKKYRFIDEFLVNSEIGNYVIKSSVYPSCVEKYIERVKRPTFMSSMKRHHNSMYEYFVKDNCDILDYDRFALAALDIAVIKGSGRYSDLLQSKEIRKDVEEYFDKKGKGNHINFFADMGDIHKEKACLKMSAPR